MLISELTFPHLAEAREARLVHELERRRVVAERLAEASADAPARARRRRERTPRTRIATNEPCPA
jgi:hypothetical protein